MDAISWEGLLGPISGLPQCRSERDNAGVQVVRRYVRYNERALLIAPPAKEKHRCRASRTTNSNAANEIDLKALKNAEKTAAKAAEKEARERAKAELGETPPKDNSTAG